MDDSKGLILITGASGYIGGRLIQQLRDKYPLRALFRIHKEIKGIECVQGDLLDRKSLKGVLTGVQTAYYLVHSMGSSGDFVEKDRIAAANFGKAASDAGVKRIIYLGGLGGNDVWTSPHLKSRHEVGQVLRNTATNVQVVEFRASIIIGSGSLSYEMIRALVDRLPFMITPKWVWTKAQPIAIKDVLGYLTDAIETKIEGNPIYEIGGKDKVSYGDIMKEYADQKGLKRTMIHVPVLSPRLSSLWLGLVTPLYARVGRKLIDSALNETTVHDPLAHHVFPRKPLSLKESIKEAILEEKNSPSRWNDSSSASLSKTDKAEHKVLSRLFDNREAWVDVSPRDAFKAIESIGGKRGYYYGNFLWRLRGFLDLLVGGAGFRRGRKRPDKLEVGDVVDFWRVEAVEPGRKLRLRAEMKLPGKAWLEFTVEGDQNKSLIRQKATFDPYNLWGKLYWYLLYPIHHFVFKGMLQGICRYIEKEKK